MKGYVVITKITSSGRPSVIVKEVDTMKENKYESLPSYDVYYDYFETIEDARRFASDML